MFELFDALSYKSTCVSFVLNPKASKSWPFTWIASMKNGSSAEKRYI